MKKRSNSKAKAASKHKQSQQVRIIGGQYKRRNISFIDADGLRPTPDRVREMLFNWLMHDIFAARVLDACAGSGVLGFEAVSRGAEHVTFIEANKQQYHCLSATAEQLKIASDNISIQHGCAEELLNSVNCTDGARAFSSAFDLVFLDPPYSLDLWQPILSALINKQLITTESKVYIEADKAIEDILADFALISDYEILKEKKTSGVYCALVRFDFLRPERNT